MEKISVCIITNKWNRLLEQVIDSVINIADEILIGVNDIEIDKNNTTYASLQKLKIINLQWQGYGATKNQLASMACNEWILSLDSDEVIDEVLQSDIKSISLVDAHHVYTMKRRNFIGNKEIKYGSWGVTNQKINRLYHRNNAHWDNKIIHEELVINEDSTLINCKGSIRHITAQHINEVKDKMMYYAIKRAKNSSSSKPVIVRLIKASFAFFKEYIAYAGVLNGYIGLQLARIQAQYTYYKYS